MVKTMFTKVIILLPLAKQGQKQSSFFFLLPLGTQG